MNDSTDIRSRAAERRLQSRPSIAQEAPEKAPESADTPAVKPLQSLALQLPLLLVVALSLVISAGAWGLRAIVLRSFERLEIANAELDLRRFANAVNHEVGALRAQLAYAVDTDGGNQGGPLDVLSIFAASPRDNRPQIACVFNRQGSLAATESDSPAGDQLRQISPDDLCRQAASESFIEQAFGGTTLAGLHHFAEVFFIVAAARVPASSQYLEPGGVILLARHFSSEEIDALAKRMAINVDFWSMDTPNLDVLEAAAGAALTLGAPIIVNKQNEDLLQVYWAFQDANGEPGFLARANVFRDLREIADETLLLSALAMGGVGLATILLSLVLVRTLMANRLSSLTQQILRVRRSGLGGQRLGVSQGILGQEDEISVMAKEFDKLLGELATTTQQLSDVSYRAGRAEVTEGSLHNVGNALNSLLASADAARAKLRSSSSANIAKAAEELARSKNLTEREEKLAQYASLAATEAGRQHEALKADINRVMVHISRIEDILESQRRHGSERDLAEPTPLLPLIHSVVAELAEGRLKKVSLVLDDSLATQPPAVCIRAITLQVLVNLLTNAIEAVERSGRMDGQIRISAATVTVDASEMVEICLADNGIGMDAAALVKVFQRHYTTKQGRGHGIGLHWSANAIAGMGGHLFARSPGRGAGAAVYLRLPAGRAARKAPDATAPDAGGRSG